MNFDLKSAKSYKQPKPIEKPLMEDSIDDAELYDNEDNYEYADYQEDYDEQEINSNVGQILHSWRAPEHEVYEKSTRWYIFGFSFIAAIVIYAAITSGPIMAITFILLGIVGYINLEKDPRVVTFAITTKGVLADKQLYLYENIYSFWIFYEKHHVRVISLHTKASMLPYIHIPLRNEDPVKLRELLLENIPEIKQNHSLIDTLERVLHI